MVNVLVEGPTDEFVALRILRAVQVEPHLVFVAGGKSNLLDRLISYNRAARFFPWLCIVDLDNDARCPPGFVAECLPDRHPRMLLRVAVREMEAWLLADRQRCADFLQVSIDRLPLDPESLPDPKRTLIDLARHSRNRDIVTDMVARPGSGGSEGPAYTTRLREFVKSSTACWRPEVAATSAPSLRRCLSALEPLAELLA